MEISKKLCITDDWTIESENGQKVFRICGYDDCQPGPEKDVGFIPDVPVPPELKLSNLHCDRYLLTFKKFSDSKATFVWLYDTNKSVLYNQRGQLAKMTELRRFMYLLYIAHKNS